MMTMEALIMTDLCEVERRKAAAPRKEAAVSSLPPPPFGKVAVERDLGL